MADTRVVFDPAIRQRCLDEHGFDPERSLLEWLETLFGGDLERASESLREGVVDPLRGAVVTLPVKVTSRQNEILQLIAHGLTTAEIAALTGAGYETVKTEVERHFVRFGARNRVHLAALWTAATALGHVHVRREYHRNAGRRGPKKRSRG